MTFFKYFVIIFLAPTLTLLNFHFLIFNSTFYKGEFEKLNVYENFQSQGEADRLTQNLINYFCCGAKLSDEYYSEREKLHLVDVKRLIRITTVEFFIVSLLSIGSLAILAKKRQYRHVIFALRWGSIVTLISILILWLSSFINPPRFEKTFVSFHEVAFSNDLWQLPQEAILIKLFPAQFFANFANRVAFGTIGMALIILVVSLLLKNNVAKKH